MLIKIISLLSVTIAFLSLVVWVYLPRNKSRYASYGSIPLADEADDQVAENPQSNILQRGDAS